MTGRYPHICELKGCLNSQIKENGNPVIFLESNIVWILYTGRNTWQENPNTI